jgi:Di-haem oxidoreductase, putative peroxidase
MQLIERLGGSCWRTGMKAQTSVCCEVTLTRGFQGGVLALLALAADWAAVVLAAPRKERSPREATPPEAAAKPDGKELFAREWIPGDPRSHHGDGLGPVFNDSSCVACHNQRGRRRRRTGQQERAHPDHLGCRPSSAA